MADTERAFAARAMVIGWKQAFLEYFADSAIGFDGETAGSAKEQLRQVPDPPKDLQLLWEPRFGDVSADGELGWLTGPSTTINPARNNGAPRYGNYASVWKRQRDGAYKVVIDVGIPTPEAPPFPGGFTAAAQPDRFRGGDGLDVKMRNQRLSAADGALNTSLLAGQAAAYRGHVTSEVRLHRPGLLPLTGSAAALTWLEGQPRYSAATTGFAEAAGSGDLGYTWGRYTLAAVAPAMAEKGFYTRVWVRERTGGWKVALDVLQPQ
jgi:ketosteroid isomerase-like protein